MAANIRKPPTSGRAKTPPKQTGYPAGGKAPLGGTKRGGPPTPDNGSQTAHK